MGIGTFLLPGGLWRVPQPFHTHQSYVLNIQSLHVFTCLYHGHESLGSASWSSSASGRSRHDFIGETAKQWEEFSGHAVDPIPE